jgi:hypothetical protein
MAVFQRSAPLCDKFGKQQPPNSNGSGAPTSDASVVADPLIAYAMGKISLEELSERKATKTHQNGQLRR